MTNRQGEFIWFELMTPDIEAARAFYTAVVGWTIDGHSGMPGMDYRMLRCGGENAGGVMELGADSIAQGAHPLWAAYVAVDDVDASAQAVREAGGHIFVPPTDIPDTGRFAMVADPQGAPLYIMRGFSDGTSTVFAEQAVGRWAWSELWTPDPEAALAFYGRLFGWRQEGAMPMGAMGDYRFLYLDETRLGAVGPLAEPGARAFWRHYVRVPSIAAAVAAIDAQGGTVTNGPHQVPGGDHIVVGRDPQGAEFALVGGA